MSGLRVIDHSVIWACDAMFTDNIVMHRIANAGVKTSEGGAAQSCLSPSACRACTARSGYSQQERNGSSKGPSTLRNSMPLQQIAMVWLTLN